MNVLLLSMPDSFEHMPPIVVRMPNGALVVAGRQHRSASPGFDCRSRPGAVAGHPHHRASDARAPARRRRVVGDDVSARNRVQDRAARSAAFDRRRELSQEGTIQASRRRRTSRVPKSIFSSAGKVSTRCASCFARSRPADRLQPIAGPVVLGRRAGWFTGRSERFPTSSRNPLRLPNRAARVLDGYTLMGRQVDVVETSRGCTYDCSFCSIIEMRGRNFHVYPIERVHRRHRGRAKRAAHGRSFWSTTTLRSTCIGSNRCARRSSMPGSTTSSISFRP